MTHRRVVLAAFFVSTCVAASGIGNQPDADAPSARVPASIRGSLYPTGFQAISSTPEEVRFTLSLPALHIRPLGGREYRLALEGGEPLAVDGAPDLPVYRRLVAVADGGDVSVAVRVDRTTFLENVQVSSYRKSPHHSPESWQSSFRQPADALGLRAKFPETNAAVEYVGRLRGQRIASLLVCPVQWDAASGRLTVATDMELVVTIDRPSGSVLSDVGPMDAALTDAVLNWAPRGTTVGLTAGPRASRGVASAGGQVCWCTGSTWEDAAASAASCGADLQVWQGIRHGATMSNERIVACERS